MNWITIPIKQKEILKGFQNYSFVLGSSVKSVAAILTKASKKAKDKVSITLMNFNVIENSVNL